MQSGSFSGSIDQVVKLLTRMEDKKLSTERERITIIFTIERQEKNGREHAKNPKKTFANTRLEQKKTFLFIELCFHFARVELK